MCVIISLHYISYCHKLLGNGFHSHYTVHQNLTIECLLLFITGDVCWKKILRLLRTPVLGRTLILVILWLGGIVI